MWSSVPGPTLDQKNTTAHEMCPIQRSSLPNLDIVLNGSVGGQNCLSVNCTTSKCIASQLDHTPTCHFARTLCFGTTDALATCRTLCSGIAGRCYLPLRNGANLMLWNRREAENNHRLNSILCFGMLHNAQHKKTSASEFQLKNLIFGI